MKIDLASEMLKEQIKHMNNRFHKIPNQLDKYPGYTEIHLEDVGEEAFMDFCLMNHLENLGGRYIDE